MELEARRPSEDLVALVVQMHVTRRNLFREFSHGNFVEFLGFRPGLVTLRYPPSGGIGYMGV